MNCEVRSHNGHMEPAIYCKSFVAKLGNCVCNCKRLANVIFSKHFPSALHKVSKSLESRCNSELSKLMKWSCSKRTSTSFKLNNWFFYVASTVSRFFCYLIFRRKKVDDSSNKHFFTPLTFFPFFPTEITDFSRLLSYFLLFLFFASCRSLLSTFLFWTTSNFLFLCLFLFHFRWILIYFLSFLFAFDMSPNGIRNSI